MRAAVVETFDRPPRYASFDDPVAGPDEALVTVEAAALSQLVRVQAAGKHYTSGRPPFVPGVDGVGRLGDGRRVYFAFPRAPFGAMAERVCVPSACIVALPAELEATAAAALANPGMSSWVALTHRVRLQPGERVLVIGAGGASGLLALQIARHLGAGTVIAAVRSERSGAAARARGADAVVRLDDSPGAMRDQFARLLADGIDVVLDYVWGASAEAFVAAASARHTADAAPRIRFVNIGALGGQHITLPAGAVRSTGLEILGSGIGSVSHRDIVAATARMLATVAPLGLRIAVRPVPICRVEEVWADADDGARIVFTAE